MILSRYHIVPVHVKRRNDGIRKAGPWPAFKHRKPHRGRLGGPKPSQCHPNPATCAAGSEALRSKVQHITLLRGCRKGRQAPSCAIRSGGVYAARSGCKPLPLSCSGRALRAQEHDVPFAARLRNSLAAKDRRLVDGLSLSINPVYGLCVGRVSVIKCAEQDRNEWKKLLPP